MIGKETIDRLVEQANSLKDLKNLGDWIKNTDWRETIGNVLIMIKTWEQPPYSVGRMFYDKTLGQVELLAIPKAISAVHSTTEFMSNVASYVSVNAKHLGSAIVSYLQFVEPYIGRR